MARKDIKAGTYFPFAFPLSGHSWQRFSVAELLPGDLIKGLDEPSFEIRKLAQKINAEPLRTSGSRPPLPAETLLALRTLNQALRHVATIYFTRDNPGSLERGRRWADQHLGDEATEHLFRSFVELFPPLHVTVGGVPAPEFLQQSDGPLRGDERATLEMLMLFLNTMNPAAKPAREVFDDAELQHRAGYLPFITGLEEYLEENEAPGSEGESIFHMLRSPILASPDSLAGQIDHIRRNWAHLLPAELVRRLQLALDVLHEIDTYRTPEYGPPPVLEFGPGSYFYADGLPEPEAFSHDAAWMSNVVLMAKSVHVWLDQLSKWHQRPITTLADIPDQELDRLARWGVTGLWLIGLWERSHASRQIKQWMGNPDAAASAYALHEYEIAQDLGGHGAYENLRGRAEARGIRLASDMVPNHMGLDSRWVVEHPDWFLQLDQPPFPAYQFTGGDLCRDERVSVRIEDGYWNHSDAAVVFQRVDNHTGEVRYIYHGNDGTSMPWNDTAQLNFLLPQVREAVVQVILHVARMFPIIRFDAAMTLAKKHYQRLWFPAPGNAGAIPSRAEHGLSKPDFDAVFPVEFWREVVDRVAAEAPDTLLLAEAFWLMEGYFVRTLGMHRVYNSAFMNMLKMEDNQKYRQTIKNVLEFSPPVLQRFVNFMNNPDEKTAVEQFGRGDKYFGCALLLVTMPGLPMLGHGQIEGFSEKYGMEYRRAMWDEHIDHDMVRRHERQIFPLMRRRRLFSGAENFALFDFHADGGWVDENVFAYSNRVDDQRALIIFNNSYDGTSGRVRLSSAINVGSADQPSLEQRSLAQALDLPETENLWCIFRDHMDGLQYIRSCRELAHEGFHTQLHGYQSRALVDFQVVEDAGGRWSRLAAHLQGGGAPDLERALRALELGPALGDVRRWVRPEILSRLEAVWLEEEAETEVALTEKESLDTSPTEPAAAHEEETEGTLRTEPEAPDLPPGTDELLTALNDLPGQLANQKLGPRSQKELNDLLERLPGSRILQAVYLAHLLKGLPGPWQRELVVQYPDFNLTADDLDLVLETIIDDLEDWTGHRYAAQILGYLGRVLAQTAAAQERMAAGHSDWLPFLLDEPAMGPLLGINHYQGKQYLRQELLESFLDAMVVTARINHPEAKLANLLDSRSLILGFARKAEFELGAFRAALG